MMVIIIADNMQRLMEERIKARKYKNTDRYIKRKLWTNVNCQPMNAK